jgi:excisionase family DNA binding protein
MTPTERAAVGVTETDPVENTSTTKRQPVITCMFVDTPTIAADLGVTTQTVRNLIARGEIPAIRIGSRLRVHRDEYEAYLRRAGALTA